MVRPVIALGSSLAALVLGPALLAGGRGGARVAAALDAFVVVVVLGVVFLHFLPHALAEAGHGMWLALALGLGLPYWAERAFRVHAGWVRALALCAFALHAMIDGAALVGAPGNSAQQTFAFALIVHRVAEGLAIRNVTRHGQWYATPLALGFVAVATVAGYLFGARVVALGESTTFAFLQTLSSGALLHVVVHGHAGSAGSPRVEAFGASLGIALMAALAVFDPELEPLRELSMGSAVLNITLHMAPVLLLGTLLTALLDRRFGSRAAQLARGRGRLGSLLLGLVSAPCGCDERHAVSGHADTIRAELVGALAHPATLLVSSALLGPGFALVRFAAGLASSMLVPIRGASFPVVRPLGLPEQRASLERALRASLGFLLVGLLTAAWLEPVLEPDALARVSPLVGVPVAALLGLPLHACAIGITPVLAMLAHKGLSSGALLAFALSASLVRLDRASPHALRTSAAAWFVSLGAGALLELGAQAADGLDLHAHARAALEPFELVCLALCAIASLRTFVTRGPSALFAPLWPRAHAH
jgi:uncharacterized protein